MSPYRSVSHRVGCCYVYPPGRYVELVQMRAMLCQLAELLRQLIAHYGNYSSSSTLQSRVEF